MPRLSRREFLARSAAGIAALAAGAPLRALAAKGGLPRPDKTDIKHVLFAMMENRSFDHLLGWYAAADGKQEGLSYPGLDGNVHATHDLGAEGDFQGCGHPDPDHSYDGGRIEYDGGACDGWLLDPSNDSYSIGYYTDAVLPFLGNAARDWTVCSRYFASIMAPTYPNRFYQHCAVTDRLDNTAVISTLPTIWDSLLAAKLDGRYYASDAPFLALWGTKYAAITRSYDDFLADCASGDLPHVGFVDPPFLGADQGVSSDDHPFSDIRAGEYWLYRTYRAVTTGRDWKHTVLVISFDEWGGFFDHVPPAEAPDVDPRFQLRGFRVPALVVSPMARRGFVADGVYDHTSVLKMIEWRWGLPPLSARDAAANNLAEALDLSVSDKSAPDYAVPPFISKPCLV